MCEDKLELILEYGVPVDVMDGQFNKLDETIALIGKASTGNITEVSLEYHRVAQFPPGSIIEVGNIVYNTITKANYLTLATMEEVIEQEVCSIVTRFSECNAEMSVSSVVESADEDGNIFKAKKDKCVHLPVHVKTIDMSLESADIGELSKSDLLVISPVTDIDISDSVTVFSLHTEQQFKVDTVNRFLFPGMLFIGLSEESRG